MRRDCQFGNVIDVIRFTHHETLEVRKESKINSTIYYFAFLYSFLHVVRYLGFTNEYALQSLYMYHFYTLKTTTNTGYAIIITTTTSVLTATIIIERRVWLAE